jgi:type I restriction enzyme, S subunit
MLSKLPEFTVSELVKNGVLEKPLDGNHGGTHPKSKDYVPEGIPFVMASDMISGRVDTSNCKFITKKQADGLRKGFAKTGDVLLSHKATIGRTAIVEETVDDYVMLTPQVTYYRIKDHDRLNNKYLRYYFDSASFQELFNQWAGGGSTRAYLGITGQLKLPIVIPPLPQQKAIAHILGSLDDKIELNRKMNQTLEAMAQALFQSWFVDFDPVIDKALANGKEIPEELSHRVEVRKKAREEFPELFNKYSDLFPDSFHYTEELGWIPEGWEASKVGEFIRRLKQKSKYTQKNVQSAGGVKVFEQATGLILGYHCNEPDIVATKEDPSFIFGDHTCITHLSTVSFSCGPNVIPIKASIRSAYWTFGAINGVQTFQEYRRHWSEFVNKDRVLPDSRICNKYDSLVSDFYIRGEILVEEIRLLSSLRDTLLPKLISGEIDVSEFETTVSEHL